MKLTFYLNIFRKYPEEVKGLFAKGKNVRNVIRLLNAHHRFTKKSKRRGDMIILRRHPPIAEILRCGRADMAAFDRLMQREGGEPPGADDTLS
jgi:hypothetical protein